jgi:MFS family permease
VSPLCETQQKRLNLIYTAGSAFTQASLFVSGIILDWKGPKITATLSTLITCLGALLFAISSRYQVDMFIVGFALMGFGGAGINLATYTVSNLFPHHKSWVVSSLVGVWTLSSLWFLIFRPSFNAGISLHALFFAQAVLLMITAVIFFITFPSRALRDGERFSFRQWLPWNAESKKLHQWVSSMEEPGDIMLETFKVSQDGDEPSGHSKDEVVTNLETPIQTPIASPTTRYPVDSPKAGGESSSQVVACMDEPVMLNLPFEDLVHGTSQFDTSGRASLERTTETGSPFVPSGEDLRSYTSTPTSLDLDPDRVSKDKSEFSPTAAKGSLGRGLAMARAVLVDVMTVDFALLALWFAIHVLFFEFYIGTIADALDFRTRQAEYPLGPAVPGALPQTKTIDMYVLVFNMLYAVGFVFVPVYAWTTDHIGFVGSFFLATLFAFLYPLVSMAPWLPSQFFAYVIYSAGIQFVYSCQFGFVAHRFGYAHFGVLVGVMGLLTACLIPLQPVFFRLVLHRFNGNFFWMYLIQAAIALPLFAIVIWNWYSSRRKAASEQHPGAKPELVAASLDSTSTSSDLVP